MVRTIIFLLLSILMSVPTASFAAPISVGAFYFGGWVQDQPGAPWKDPWAPLKSFPERKPQLGWYDGASPEVIEQQLAWMRGAGLKFLVFDWYYDSSHHQEKFGRTLEAFMRVNQEAKMPFALLWANDKGSPASPADWDIIVNTIVSKYILGQPHLEVDGRAVIFILSPGAFSEAAKAAGASDREFLGRLQAAAMKRTGHGVYIVACGDPSRPEFAPSAQSGGYSALSGYNFGWGGPQTPGAGYVGLDEFYRLKWKRYVDAPTLPTWIPMTAGWDNSPWQKSGDLRRPSERPISEAEFEAHLNAGLEFIQSNKKTTAPFAVVCCWNEFGEGSIIEPTFGDGFRKLDALRAVLLGLK